MLDETNLIIMDHEQTVVMTVTKGIIQTRLGRAFGKTIPNKNRANGRTMASIRRRSVLVAFMRSD